MSRRWDHAFERLASGAELICVGEMTSKRGVPFPLFPVGFLVSAVVSAGCSHDPPAPPAIVDASAAPPPPTSASASASAAAITAMPPPLQTDHDYAGTIGKNLHFTMHLHQIGAELSGTYGYATGTGRLDVHGSVAAGDAFELTESNAGAVTGHFQGTMNPDGTLVGRWSDAKGARALPFAAAPGEAGAPTQTPAAPPANLEVLCQVTPAPKGYTDIVSRIDWKSMKGSLDIDYQDIPARHFDVKVTPWPNGCPHIQPMPDSPACHGAFLTYELSSQGKVVGRVVQDAKNGHFEFADIPPAVPAPPPLACK